MNEHNDKPSPIKVITDRNGDEFTIEAILEASLKHAKRALESLEAAYDMHIGEANDAAKQAEGWRKAVAVIESKIAEYAAKTKA